MYAFKSTYKSFCRYSLFFPKDSEEKRVGFQDDDDQNEDEENDKRPVSKLHRRDTPHHLKNKRVQQHLNDKAANVILSKLKEKPHLIPTVEEIQSVEMNPMPLVQDVGLPIIEDIVDVNQNGIEISSSIHGKFKIFFFNVTQTLAK